MISQSITIFHIAAIFSLVNFVSSQNIIDFQYSEYLKNVERSTHSAATFSIKSSQIKYQFPEVCYLKENLQSGSFEFEINNFDNDDYVNDLKKQFTELLKLSQQIKHKTYNLQDMALNAGWSLSSNTPVRIVTSQQMQMLSKQQQRLNLIDQQIKDKSNKLQKLVKQMMQNSQNNQFVKKSVIFDIQSYKLKKKYLNQLLRQSVSTNSQDVQKRYNEYFNDLRIKFNQENSLFKDLDSILSNYSQIGELKQKISALRDLIALYDLSIEQKNTCVNQIDEIRNQQKKNIQIKDLMSFLREKKMDPSNLNNKYCDGVAKKLIVRVKEVLKAYNFNFRCAEGLQEYKENKKKDEKTLQEYLKKLQELQSNAGIIDYKDIFQKNRQYINNKNEQLKAFTIDPYYHDPSYLRVLLAQTQDDLKGAQQRLTNLNNPTQYKQIDYMNIENLVNSIKNLKGNYCKEYDIYNEKSKKIQSKINHYEANLEYQKKIAQVYMQQQKQLNELKQNFEDLRMKLATKVHL